MLFSCSTHFIRGSIQEKFDREINIHMHIFTRHFIQKYALMGVRLDGFMQLLNSRIFFFYHPALRDLCYILCCNFRRYLKTDFLASVLCC